MFARNTTVYFKGNHPDDKKWFPGSVIRVLPACPDFAVVEVSSGIDGGGKPLSFILNPQKYPLQSLVLLCKDKENLRVQCEQ